MSRFEHACLSGVLASAGAPSSFANVVSEDTGYKVTKLLGIAVRLTLPFGCDGVWLLRLRFAVGSR